MQNRADRPHEKAHSRHTEDHTLPRAQLVAEALICKGNLNHVIKERDRPQRCTGPGSVEPRDSFSYNYIWATAPP